jgi:hypothetical protein
LEEEFGNPGVIAIYLEFKAAMETQIPANADPSLALNKIFTHFGRLADNSVEVPQHLQAMIVLSKFPPYLDTLAQIMCQVDDVKELTVDKITRRVALAWEQKSRVKTPRPQQQAQKISAVRRGPNEPHFQQQQQQYPQQQYPQQQQQGEGS